MASPEYKLLEPDSLSSLGIASPSFDGASVSFLSITTFLWMLAFSFIIGAAFYRLLLAGGIRMRASEADQRKSNEMIKRVTLGLFGVFSLFLLLFTVNRGLLTGDVSLEGLRNGQFGSSINTTGVLTSSGSVGSTKACESPENVKTKINSPDGVCGGAICTALSGCSYQQYLPIIDQETSGDTTLKKMIIVTLCKESSARVDVQRKNADGTFDCGLMQINQKTPCDAAILVPSTNIKEGVRLMKQKISYTNQIYPGFPREAGIFSSYVCCSNGTVPNSQSADCTSANGFPSAVPKWACPINPGTGEFNMCSVKGYACELTACMKQL